MKYRKKPVVIEAFQYDGDLKDSNGNYYVPDWAVKAYESGVMHYDSPDCDSPPCELYIDTLEGTRHVSVGDYIIKGVNDELYPRNPDLFAKTYETAGAEIENPKIKIVSDGNRTILHLNGENARGRLLDFSFHADVETGKAIVVCEGKLNKTDKMGNIAIKDDKVVEEKFRYDSRESTEIQFEEVK